MACNICGRLGCASFLHSLKEQEMYGELSSMEDRELREEIIDNRKEISDLRAELEQYKKIAADNQAWFEELKAEFASARSSAFSECADICESRHANGAWKYDTRHECAEAIREFAKMQPE